MMESGLKSFAVVTNLLKHKISKQASQFVCSFLFRYFKTQCKIKLISAMKMDDMAPQWKNTEAFCLFALCICSAWKSWKIEVSILSVSARLGN